MFRPRIIPVLLLKDKGLVKTVRFKKPVYIGDPINAVKIFNDMEADELVFLDITATSENRGPSVEVISKIGDEAFMPFAVGGGIRSAADVKQIINAGAEKVVINTAACHTPNVVADAAYAAGSQSVIVCIDVKKNIFGKYVVMAANGKTSTGKSPEKFAEEMAKLGAGEIMVNSIDQDGVMTGYDLTLIRSVASAVDVPVIASGGAGILEHFAEAVKAGANAVAAGSMFVFHGSRRGVLINYPDRKNVENLFL